MRRLLLHTSLILTVLLLTSCRPKGVLSTQEMTDVLFDIHLVEAMSYDPYGQLGKSWTQGLSEIDFSDLAYLSVLRKHAISEEEFFSSVAYYSKKLRLFTRIYVDLDKRFDEYIHSIDTWTENKKTEMAVNALMRKEDARVRAFYEYLHIKPDPALKTPFSFRPDSVKVMKWRRINRLMRRSLSTKPAYSMIGLKNLTDRQGNALADSTGQAIGGGTANGDIPSVDVLLQKALPIEELLRLRDAGAYDALMAPTDQTMNQPATPTTPSNQPDRAKRLRERATNRR